MFSDREPTVMEGKDDMREDLRYMSPPGIQRVARFSSNRSPSPSKGQTQSFRGTFGEEFVSPTIEKRFAAMDERIRVNKGAVSDLRSELRENREALNEIRSSQRRNVEALNENRTEHRRNTEALDEIRSTLRKLVPDSKSAITSSPRKCFRCDKTGHFRKDCPMRTPPTSPYRSPKKREGGECPLKHSRIQVLGVKSGNDENVNTVNADSRSAGSVNSGCSDIIFNECTDSNNLDRKIGKTNTKVQMHS